MTPVRPVESELAKSLALRCDFALVCGFKSFVNSAGELLPAKGAAQPVPSPTYRATNSAMGRIVNVSLEGIAQILENLTGIYLDPSEAAASSFRSYPMWHSKHL